MKATFITTGSMPGTREFTATMFTLESDHAANAAELKDLARKATKQYAMTDSGCAAYENNCDNFCWGDMVGDASNPEFQKLCDALHLKITWLGSTGSDDLWVDQDEQLMEDLSMEVTNIEWDTDDDEDDDAETSVDLPSVVTLTLNSPTTDIADALSDEYGYCVRSYQVGEVF